VGGFRRGPPAPRSSLGSRGPGTGRQVRGASLAADTRETRPSSACVQLTFRYQCRVGVISNAATIVSVLTRKRNNGIENARRTQAGYKPDRHMNVHKRTLAVANQNERLVDYRKDKDVGAHFARRWHQVDRLGAGLFGGPQQKMP